jgi:hypothetical protein
MTDPENASTEEPDSTTESSATDSALNDAESVVAAFGGVRPMAARLDMAATTIQGWKSRGNIPQNRRQAVLDAAAAAGIDLTAAAVSEDLAPSPAPPSAVEPDSHGLESAEAKQSNGIAWVTLVVAVAAGIAVVTLPKWSPIVYGETPSPDFNAFDSRIGALEKRPRTPDMSQRVAALEGALSGLRSRAPVNSPAPDLTPKLNALSARLDGLAQALSAARMEGRDAIDGKTADLAALGESLAALSTRIEQAVVDTAASNTRKSSLIVAVGALEVALGDGSPFGFALDAMKRLANAGDERLSGPVAVLAPHAATGIPTRAQLAGRLSKLVATRGEPLWSTEGESWSDKVLRKVDSVIKVRRLDEKGGEARRLVNAEKDFFAGDLPGAINQLEGMEGSAAAWLDDAKKHMAAAKALSKLRLLAIEHIDQPAVVKKPAQ